MSGTNCSYCGTANQAAAQACVACGDDLELQPFPASDQTSEWEPVIDPDRPLADIAPFGVDTAISETVSLFTSNLWLITKIVVVTVAPFELFRAFSLAHIGDQWGLTAWTFFHNAVGKVLVAPALIYALMKIILTGQEPGVHESYRWGLTKFGKLCICAVIMSVLQWLGYSLLIIPGIIITLVFILVYPIAVLEKGPVSEVFARSVELTGGHWFQILSAWIVMVVPVVILWVLNTFMIDSSPTYWPLAVIVGLAADILDQLLIVLSLVMYLSLPRISAGGGGSHSILSLK